MKDAVVEQAVSGAGEQTTEENVPTLSVEEISTLGEMVKTVESTTETPSEPIDDPLLVDFTQDGTYSFTKPVSTRIRYILQGPGIRFMWRFVGFSLPIIAMLLWVS